MYARHEVGHTTSKMIKALPTTPTVARVRSRAVSASVSPGAAERMPSTQRTMVSLRPQRLSIHSPAAKRPATVREEMPIHGR